MAITRVQTVGVYVRDQQAALDFYKDKLGFEVRQDAPMGEPGGDRWIEVVPPGAETGIVLSTPASMGGFTEPITSSCSSGRRRNSRRAGAPGCSAAARGQ